MSRSEAKHHPGCPCRQCDMKNGRAIPDAVVVSFRIAKPHKDWLDAQPGGAAEWLRTRVANAIAAYAGEKKAAHQAGLRSTWEPSPADVERDLLAARVIELTKLVHGIEYGMQLEALPRKARETCLWKEDTEGRQDTWWSDGVVTYKAEAVEKTVSGGIVKNGVEEKTTRTVWKIYLTNAKPDDISSVKESGLWTARMEPLVKKEKTG